MLFRTKHAQIKFRTHRHRIISCNIGCCAWQMESSSVECGVFTMPCHCQSEHILSFQRPTITAKLVKGSMAVAE